MASRPGGRGRGLGLIVVGLAWSPRNPVGYVARAAVGQANMLLGRISFEQALDEGYFTEEQAAKLQMVPEILAFGETVGLAHTDNYRTVHPTWDQTIWNVSACESLAFRPKRYWFPIVGSITYIGYFDEALAEEQRTRLQEQGYDVRVRTVGAYSTLGWFRDPVLPGMLDWSEAGLAETLLHELAHATLWVPGHADFNESFANFVGVVAARQWLVARHGADSGVVADFDAGLDDDARTRMLLDGVIRELEVIYESAQTDAQKQIEKAAILATLPDRAASAGFARAARAERFADPSTWNNARLLQYRTYNRGQDGFADLFGSTGGRLDAFIEAVRQLVQDADDPWHALGRATGRSLDQDAFGG